MIGMGTVNSFRQTMRVYFILSGMGDQLTLPGICMYEVKLQNGEIINAYEDEIDPNYCGDYEA